MPQKVESGALKGFSGKLEDLNLIIKQMANGTTYYSRLPKRLTTPISSPLQLKYRVWMSLMVNNYAPFAGLLNYSFEETKRRQRMRNLFVKYNVKEEGCYITKEMREAGAQILGNFWVSKGPDTIPSIDVRYDGDNSRFVTNIGLGDLQIDEHTTQAQFAKAIGMHNGRDFRIATDETFYADDLSESITLMFAHQWLGVDSKQPSITVETYQIPLLALDEAETRKLSDIVPLSLLQVVEVQNGSTTRRCLALPKSTAIEMATVIHSWRKGHAVIRCTSQRLVGPNPLRDSLLTLKACVAAFKSFGPVNWKDNYNPLNDPLLSLLPEAKPDISGVGTSGLPTTGGSVGDDSNPNPGGSTGGTGSGTGNTDPTYTLTVVANPAGKATFTLTPEGPYHEGDQVQVRVTPVSGYSFTGWQGGGNQNPRTVTIGSSDLTLTANLSTSSGGDL